MPDEEFLDGRHIERRIDDLDEGGELLKLTFSGGFRSKRFYSFGPSTLAKLASYWRYA